MNVDKLSIMQTCETLHFVYEVTGVVRLLCENRPLYAVETSLCFCVNAKLERSSW